jgi:DNA-binding SARP family transcriptional activator
MVEFALLGPLEVFRDGTPIRLGGPKQRATLAILLLNANRVVSVDRLADDLYRGEPPVTAVTQVQRQISELRKVLGTTEIETRAPGYVLHVPPDQLDLGRFERLAEDGSLALARGEAERAAALLREALALWRGSPLADLAYEPFAQTSIARLEEIRLATLQQRVDADLQLGRQAALVAELEALVSEDPAREGLRAQLMLALYRSGRQADALDAYRRGRDELVSRFGLEPAPALRRLEQAILTQDPALDVAPRAAEATRALLIAALGDADLDASLGVVVPLARQPGRELIAIRLVAGDQDLATAAAQVEAGCAGLDVPARGAVLTSDRPADDLVRLASVYDADLLLVHPPADLDTESLPPELIGVLERSPVDVGIVAGTRLRADGAGVFVPFVGGEHDWAALELGAWLASSTDTPLTLIGSTVEGDGSRLLADASLAVQRAIGVPTEPALAEPGQDGLLAAVHGASIVVVGVSERWRERGLGPARRALVRSGSVPALLVHHGPRPGGLAPSEARTRFTWTVQNPY